MLRLCHLPSSDVASGLSYRPITYLPISNALYFVSLCPVCFRQNRQYLLISRRSDDFFRFFVVL
jgi:hypothetical protein